MDANKLFTKFAVEKIWNKLKQHDKAMNSVLLILLPSNWVLQDGKYKNTVKYSGFKSSDKLTVDLYDDGNLSDLQLTEYEHYIDGFEIIDGALVAIASVKPTQTMTVVVKGGFQANESEVGDLSVIEDELNILGNRPVNNNILINSNFANPVNQRGYVSGTVISDTLPQYTIDRWKLSNGMSLTVNPSKSITLTNTNSNIIEHFVQPLENTDCLTDKQVAFSAKVNGKVYQSTYLMGADNTNTHFGGDEDGFKCYIDYASGNSNYYMIVFAVYPNTSITIEWAKLELGDHATPYVPRLYEEEWHICQRYYQIIQNVQSIATISANGIYFVMPVVDITPRIKGTVTLVSNYIVTNGSTVIDGFTFSVTNVSFASVTVLASKNSHGLSVSDLPRLTGYLTYDAEL